MVGADFILNYSLPINKTMHIVLSIVLITHTIFGSTHSNSFKDYIHTIFIIVIFKISHILSSIIKIYD